MASTSRFTRRMFRFDLRIELWRCTFALSMALMAYSTSGSSARRAR